MPPKPMSIFMQIRKVDEEKRMVYGTMTEEIPDKSGEIFDYASGKDAVGKWSQENLERSGGKSQGNVREMHSNIAAGKITEINYDDAAKRIEAGVHVVDDGSWNKVLEGVLTGFSIGGSYTKTWSDPADPAGTMRFTPKLVEMSLVDNPCVPTATFEVRRMDGTTEMRKFNPQLKEVPMSDQQTTNTPSEADLLKAAKEAVANGTATDEQKELLTKATSGVAPQDKDDVKQRWLDKEGGQHLTKALAVRANIEIDARRNVSDIAKSATDALGKLTAALDKVANDGGDNGAVNKADPAGNANKADDGNSSDNKPYGDVKYADPGYQEDKKKRYPVDTEKHIRAAWSYINKKKNQGKYTSEQVTHIKDAIIAAWKEKIDDQGPPSATEKSVRTDNLKKGLNEVARLAYLIQELDWLQSCVEMEAEWEKDASPLPAEIKTQIAALCTTLKAMVDEETGELFEDDGEDHLLEEVLMAGAGMNVNALAKHVAGMRPFDEKELEKPEVKALAAKYVAFKNALEKAGARHSKVDKAHLAKAMGHLEDAGEHLHKAEKAHKAIGKEHDGAEEAHGDMEKCIGDMTKCFGTMKADGHDEHHEMHKELKGHLKKMAGHLEKLDGHLEKAEHHHEKMGSHHDGIGEAHDEAQGELEAAGAGSGDEPNEKTATGDGLNKADNVLVAENAELRKTISSLQEGMEGVLKRVDDLERLPMPGKGKLRAVSKADDSAGGNGGAPANDQEVVDEWEKMTKGMSESEKNRLLLKAALRNGVTVAQ